MTLRRFLVHYLVLVLLVVIPFTAIPEMSLAQDAADKDPRKPAAIVTEGVPKVPAALAAKLQQYQNMRGGAFLGWAPDGSGILIRTRFANTPQLHRVYVPGGRREQVTFFDEPVSGGFIPKAKDSAMLLSQSTGGNENNQVYFFDPKKYQTTLLTDGKSRFGIGPFVDGTAKFVLSSNERNGRDTDLYLADSRTPNSREMLWQVSGEFWTATDWAPDGKRLLMVRFVSATESYPAWLDTESKMKHDLDLPGEEKAAVGSLSFAADGKSVWITTDAESEFQRLARLSLETGTYEWFSDDLRWDVSDVEVDETSGAVAFIINEDGASRLFLIEKQSSGKMERRELKIPLGILTGLEFSPDGKQLGFTLARPESVPDAYSLEISTGVLTRWTYSEMGGLDPSGFVVPTRVRYPSFDGREIPAYYYRPNSATANSKAPVLISIHGGPESQFQPFFSPSVQFYVKEMGIAVLAPNVRGSSGYGKTYLKLDNVELREDSVKDIGALLDWVGQQPELDANRVAVVGGSYGGYMVLASLIHYGDRIKAGVDVVGIANFLTFLESTAAYRQDLRRVEYGDERDPQVRAFLEKISPTTNVDAIRSSLLVVHGKNDPRVPVGEATQIAAKVKEIQIPVWTVIADNEGHGFSKKDNNDYERAVEVMFLEQFLKKSE